jgi:hypothetical protein
MGLNPAPYLFIKHMNKLQKLLKISVVAIVATITFSSCKEQLIEPISTVSNELVGTLTTQTLNPSIKYVIKGVVVVPEGVVLTIPAGTVLAGQKSSKGTLLIKVGGQLIAEGTESKPIVFTSNQNIGEREQGDWGGIVMLGKANVNQNNPAIEGISPAANYGTFNSSAANVRTLNMGSSNWTLTSTGIVWVINATSMTLNCGQSKIIITNTSATANTFSSTGSLTYYTIEYSRGGGAGNLIFGSTTNTTITNFIDNTSTAAHSIQFQSGQWNFYKFNVRGTAGALVTISRSGTTSPTIAKVGQGIVPYCDYLNIVSTGFTATPANTWYAGANSAGSGGGWVMTAAPSSRSLLGAGGVG